MKLLIFLVICFSKAVVASPPLRTPSSDFQVSSILTMFQAKCERYSPSAYSELWATIRATFACATQLEKKLNASDHLCEKLITSPDLYDCIKPIGDKLRHCLYEEEQFLPTFIYGAFNHTVAEFCETEGQAKLLYIKNSFRNDACLRHSFTYETLAASCFHELAIFRTAHNTEGHSFTVKESEICLDTINFQNCVTNATNSHCTSRDYTTLVRYLIEPFWSWCEKHEMKNDIEDA